MLGKRDGIFWAASAILLLSLALAALVDDGFLLLLVAAYLLRPTLHSLGFFSSLVDERQMQIQYRASNVGFVAMVAGIIVVMLVLMGKGDHTWEMLVAVLMVGLVVRALAGLLMIGDPLVAGVRIIVSLGLLLALFGIAEGGVAGAVAHVIPGALVVGLGLAAKRWPRPVAYLVLALAVLVAVFMTRSVLAGGFGRGWGEVLALVLLTAPPIVAAVCLLRGAAEAGGTVGSSAP